MRHAEAESGEPMDMTRQLTEGGKQQARIMAAFMKRYPVEAVISSNFRRALDTATPIAEAMGLQVQDTPALDPMGVTAAKAIAKVKKLAGAGDAALVVTHHPLISGLLKTLCGAHTGDHSFAHGSIAAIDTEKEHLHWFVRPEQIAAPELSEALEAGIAACDALLGESLRHKKHMRILRPIQRTVRSIMAGFFRQQKKAVVDAVRNGTGLLTEASGDSERKARLLIPDTLAALSLSVGASDADDYSEAIRQAIDKAGAQLATELDTGTTIPPTVSGDYLRTNSLDKLTGELATTTRKRLRNAIADAYDSGGTADDIVSAIKSEFADMADKRANVIAQTQVNRAYNFGRKALASSAGMTDKRWVTESGDPCPTCLANAAQGWIPIGATFSSGDDGPVAHPSCYCSLDFRSAVK